MKFSMHDEYTKCLTCKKRNKKLSDRYYVACRSMPLYVAVHHTSKNCKEYEKEGTNNE